MAMSTEQDLLMRALPMLRRLGDFIGNGEVDPDRPGSLGARCDLIIDIRDALGPDLFQRTLDGSQ
jgi:hypothetical protein